MSVFRTELSSCVVRHKRNLIGGVMSHCVQMLHHVIIDLLDLVTSVFCYFCVAFYQCFDIEKFIKEKERNQEMK